MAKQRACAALAMERYHMVSAPTPPRRCRHNLVGRTLVVGPFFSSCCCRAARRLKARGQPSESAGAAGMRGALFILHARRPLKVRTVWIVDLRPHWQTVRGAVSKLQAWGCLETAELRGQSGSGARQQVSRCGVRGGYCRVTAPAACSCAGMAGWTRPRACDLKSAAGSDRLRL